MLKHLIAALLFAAGPATALDPAAVSRHIAENGLAATETALEASPADATTRFALGGVRFLRAIEKTLQTRWRFGINAARTELPILRLPVPPNDTPEPFTPEVITGIFTDLITDMTAARDPLLQIADGDEVSLPIAIEDLWFDVNMNGTREDGEGVIDIGGRVLSRRPPQATDSPVIRFDTADAAWLAAYTHFLSGLAELVLAFDPTKQIARVSEASAAMDALAPESGYSNAMDMQFGQQVDRLAMIYFALRQQPDATHTRAARLHFLSMIDLNTTFWTRAAAETDNDGEWIPNAGQVQALGIEVPTDTADRWQAVLADARALLDGEKLMPHWRLHKGAGLNLKKMFENPVPVDLAEWIHGIGLLPFAEEGQRVSNESWRDFELMMGGDAILFVVFLN